MVSEVFIQNYSDFPYNIREILRYAGCRDAQNQEDVMGLLNSCTDEVSKNKACTFNIAYRILPINSLSEETGDIDFELIKVNSKKLALNLNGCQHAVFFSGTLGQGLDRLIYRYNKLDPARALFMQAIGAERIETMLDVFCKSLPEKVTAVTGESVSVRPRFSPGYGDLSIRIQPDFLNLLNANKRLGITLNESLLMSPSKSVTAIAGAQRNGL